MQVNPFNILTEGQAKKQQRAHHLGELTRQWDKPIRAGLSQLARTIWSNGFVFGLIPALPFAATSFSRKLYLVDRARHPTLRPLLVRSLPG